MNVKHIVYLTYMEHPIDVNNNHCYYYRHSNHYHHQQVPSEYIIVQSAMKRGPEEHSPTCTEVRSLCLCHL